MQIFYKIIYIIYVYNKKRICKETTYMLSYKKFFLKCDQTYISNVYYIGGNNLGLFHKNEQVFETVYNNYANMVYRLALSHLNHNEDAQDVVQDVFTKYMCGLHLPMNAEHEKAWFIRVTINHCHDIIRRRKHRTYMPLDEVSEIPAQEVELPFMLQETLQNLPEKYKSVIILHYLEGFSVQEIAKICRISVSATKMRLLRGRELLKGELEKEN